MGNCDCFSLGYRCSPSSKMFWALANCTPMNYRGHVIYVVHLQSRVSGANNIRLGPDGQLYYGNHGDWHLSRIQKAAAIPFRKALAKHRGLVIEKHEDEFEPQLFGNILAKRQDHRDNITQYRPNTNLWNLDQPSPLTVLPISLLFHNYRGSQKQNR